MRQDTHPERNGQTPSAPPHLALQSLRGGTRSRRLHWLTIIGWIQPERPAPDRLS